MPNIISGTYASGGAAVKLSLNYHEWLGGSTVTADGNTIESATDDYQIPAGTKAVKVVSGVDVDDPNDDHTRMTYTFTGGAASASFDSDGVPDPGDQAALHVATFTLI